MTDRPHTLLAGIGSPNGDDRIGWQVAERLQSRLAGIPAIAVRKAAVPLDLLDWLDDVRTLHVVDACLAEDVPGSVTTLTADASDSDRGTMDQLLSRLEPLDSGGSHDFGLAQVLALAGRLDRLPERVVVHAVAARQFAPAAPLSDDLACRLPDIAEWLYQELTDARSLARAVAAEPG